MSNTKNMTEYVGTKNMVEYIGTKNIFPSDISSFTQFSLDDTLCVDNCKPEILKVLQVDTSANIDNVNIIKTPIGTSLEGQILTGYKALICGHLDYIIVYSTKYSKSLYSSMLTSNFCNYIVLPNNFSKSTPICVKPYIEDVFVFNDDEYDCLYNNNKRCIYVCASIFLNAKLCCSVKDNNCCYNNSIKLNGVCDTFPKDPKYFKEITCTQTFDNLIEPNIKEIISISSKINIISKKLIPSTEGSSLEGQTLNKYKLLLELECNDVIVYSNKGKRILVNSMSFNNSLPCISIVLPNEIDNIDISTLYNEDRLIVKPYIEGMCISNNNCNVSKCLSLFVDVSARYI